MAAIRKLQVGFIATALLVCVYATEIYQRAAFELRGTVVSSETTCVQPYNNRCATAYVFEGHDHSRSSYVAGSSNRNLPLRLPVGAEIVKNKWALAYFIDGHRISDFPIGFDTGLLVLGLCLVWWWYAESRGVP